MIHLEEHSTHFIKCGNFQAGGQLTRPYLLHTYPIRISLFELLTHLVRQASK